MPVTWFQSQQAAEAPIAPLSSQQAAARWEPSVQDFVTELGGYTIPELQQCIEQRWTTKFNIAKVWKAMDAISDQGLQRYLQHHWVIMKLVPADIHSNCAVQGREDGNASAGGDCPSKSELASQPLQSQTEREAKELAKGSEEPGYQDRVEHTLGEEYIILPGSSSAEAHFKRQKASSQNAEDRSSPTAVSSAPEQPHEEQLTTADLKESERPDQTQDGEVKLSTEQELTIEQTKQLQPQADDGLNLAARGLPWFLRVDRFNEADKWFACATFENAMQSEQARNRHFSPTSEVAFEGKSEMRLLPLECIVPSMARLAAVGYSVFATGNHCQWHARVLTVLIASLSFFLTPCNAEDNNYAKVSRILVDGKEQQKYAAMAGKSGRPEGSYYRAFPETPYLKPAIQDLKQYAGQDDDQELRAVAKKPFPDLHLVYASMLPPIG